MKKIMFLLMMMAITVIGMSQTIGDSYQEFINTGHYEKGVDDSGNGYLLQSFNEIRFKYYFEDGICDVIMITSTQKNETDEIFNAWIQEVTNQYESESGFNVYVVNNFAKFIYHYKYVNGTKIYILEIFLTN
jgi:hypothetical protein